MTRHMLNQLSYTNDTSLEYRHPASRIPPTPAPVSHDRSYALARSNPRADPMARQSSRSSPASHAGNSAAGPPRRRIPVACGRCRKRKIRCSGDPGDSSGCNNCKGAQVGPGLCVFLRVQCEMRELVPDHVLMMGGYEQVSSKTMDLHPYSSSSSASSSASSLALAGLPHPIHSTTGSQNYMSPHSLRIGGHHQNMHSNNHTMSLKSLYHQDPMGGNGDGGAGLLLTGNIGIPGHRTQYDGLGGDMTGGAIHGSSNNGMSVGNGDIYNGNYPQYMHPDIGQGMTNSVLHGQHWAPLGGRQNSSLYLDQDQSTMQNYISAPNQSLGAYPVVFPALTSLSSSLPDGISPRTPVNEKVQLPLPIRTQASEVSNATNLRPSSIGNSLENDTVSSGYGSQTLQTSYRAYTPWGGDNSFSTSQSASMAVPTTIPAIPSQQTPALPVPCPMSTYGTHNNHTFPLSSSNISLLPASSHQNSNISNSPIDSFSSQNLPHSHQKGRSNSESSNGSKSITPAPIMRTNSTSSSSYSPSYSRSSVDINTHGAQPLQQRRTLGFNKVF